ncbi:MAG: hypothetical protein ACQEQL_04535 [Pseudomonadota bacterium]
MTSVENNEKHTKTALNIYIIFVLFNVIGGLTDAMAIIGLIIMIFAVVAAYSGQQQAQALWLKSHFRWQIRTFWIGLLVVAPLVMILTALLILIPVIQPNEALGSGFVIDAAAVQSRYQEYEILISASGYAINFAWWVSRCWTGYEALQNGDPSPVPAKVKDNGVYHASATSRTN